MCTNNNTDFSSSTAGKVNFNTHFTENFLLNEAFKTLRSNLLFCGSDFKTILITSTVEGEGKTTISTELAKSLAQIKKKTLLIYGDMRKPNRISKNREIVGLSELLAGKANISQVVYSTQNPFLNVIFGGKLPENPVELLTSENLALQLNELKNEYDYIIIDSPPLTPVIDAALISVHCDGAILVIASEKATVRAISMSKEQLKRSNCKILGAILNQTHENLQSKYYAKKHYYYSDSSPKSN